MSLRSRKRSPFPGRRLTTMILPLVLVAAVSACGSDSQATPSGLPFAGGSAGTAITISSFQFSPDPLSAKVGDAITITNNDRINHTVTAIDGSFDTGPWSSGTRTITLTRAGTIPYHCSIHNFMTGTIQVS